MIRDAIKPDVTMFVSHAKVGKEDKNIIMVTVQKGMEWL